MAQETEKTKVLIVDKQPLFRQGIRHFLAQVDGIEICGEAGSVEECLAAVNNSYPDVVLLDVSISDSSLDLARTVKQQLPRVAIVLITPELNDEELFQAIKARADAYIEREATSDKLIETISRSAGGEYPINETFVSHPGVAIKVLDQFRDLTLGEELESFISPLTARETEILNHMAQGCLNKQIANSLSISEQTIKNHITSILRKLNANARTQAVIVALKRGLISLG